MPELPEVHSITQALKVFEGHSIVGLKWNIQVTSINDDIAPFASQLSLPLLVNRIGHHGKQIFLELTDSTGREWVINSFMGMSGRWSWTQQNHTMVILEFAPGAPRTAIYFIDPRHMGHFKIMTREQADQKKSKMGPDLYQQMISWELWATRWFDYMTRHPKHHLCQAIMDQDLFAGVGNYLKAEILYAAGLSPHRVITLLDNNDMERLYYHTIVIIRASVEAGGLTIKDFWHPDGRAGVFQQKIYGNKTDPLGNPVVTEKTKDTRTTHWVPLVQK